MELWNRWCIEVGKVGRILLLAKAKSGKNFFIKLAPCVRFCGIVESSVDSAESAKLPFLVVWSR